MLDILDYASSRQSANSMLKMCALTDMLNLSQKVNSLEKENKMLTKNVDIIKNDFCWKEAKQIEIEKEKENKLLSNQIKEKDM